MKLTFRVAAVAILLALIPAAAIAQSHELAVTAGGNFPKNDQYNPGKSFAVGAQYDGRFFHVPMVSVYLDVPIVVATKSSFTDPSCASPCTFQNNYRSFFFTPGVKVKLTPPIFPLQPYVVAGVGIAHYNMPNAPIFGNNSSNKAAFEVGGGLDMKIFPHLSARGEVRDFINGTPNIASITQSGQQHNIVPQVGLVLRF